MIAVRLEMVCRSLAFLTMCAVAAPVQLAAQPRPTPQVRKAQTVSPWAFEHIDRAHKLLEEEKYDQVIAVLDTMAANRRLNDHERALLWQAYAYAYTSQEKYAQAAEAFEKCLATNGLPEAAALSTRYHLAQLYVLLERYQQAIALFEQWFERAEKPSPVAYYMLALAYLQNGEMQKALPLAEQAVIKTDKPKEAWLGLLLSIRLERKEYEQAATVLEKLAELYPKKLYWMQLAAVYSEAGKPERALAALEVADAQGLLTEEKEVISLAELYLYNQLPYKAARVLERGLREGVVSPTARHWELLADSWMHARERSKALAPLARAAELADSGDTYVRLAQIYLEREQWKEALAALSKGLKKGKLRNPALAQLFYGIASAGEQHWDQAEAALQEAGKEPKYEKIASQWLAAVERERMLARQAPPDPRS